MRYYDITISVPKPRPAKPGQAVRAAPVSRVAAKPGQILTPPPFQWLYQDTSYTSYPNGRYNPNALDIEFQIHNYAFSQPGASSAGSYVRIYGVSREELDQANDLNDMEIVIKGGMIKGLPLAKPEQAGVLATGTIFQAFGNWIGNSKSLDLLLQGPPLDIRDFQFVWKRGQSLKAAIAATLRTAMPEYQPVIEINGNVQTQSDQTNTCATFIEFAQFINRITNTPINRNLKQLNGSAYAGVTLTLGRATSNGITPTPPTPQAGENKVISVYDLTVPHQKEATVNNPMLLQYEDFIGQPTWIGPSTVQFNLVLRADLKVGDYVRIPRVAGLFAVSNKQSAMPGAHSRDTMNFGNNTSYNIQKVLHHGKFREQGAESWISTYEAVYGTTQYGQTPNA